VHFLKHFNTWNQYKIRARYTERVPLLQPMPVAVARAAFSHPDWIFELK